MSAVKRAYKYRFYPTDEQAQQFAQTFGCVRYVYNRGLAVISSAWQEDKKRVRYPDVNRMLTGWRQDAGTDWLALVPRATLTAALMNLDAAYAGFFRKKGKYPRFKKKGRSKETATYYRNAFRYRDGAIVLAKQNGPLAIRWSRPLPEAAYPSSVTVSRDSAGRYHVSILVEDEVSTLPPTDHTVGIDAGITSLYTLSTGEKIPNPRHEKRDRKKLARAQKELARKQKGSQNRAKARLKVARIHARIADRRRDHLHKLSTRLIRENQAVIVEDLAVRNMVRNHSLARSISDASWSELRRQLEYKSRWYGRQFVAVDRFFPSSKLCSECGVVQEKMALAAREWTCLCGALHDRDVNAAKNIRAAGLAVLARGDDVRPTRRFSGGRRASMKRELSQSGNQP